MPSLRTSSVLLVGLAALVLCLTGAAAAADPPPLYLTYRANGTLGVSLADGSSIGSGTTIPPGPYWVTFTNDFPAERDGVHKWHIFGAGIDIWTDLNCSDSTIEQYLETLHAGSTYTVQDDYHPSLQVVFRTAATGSSTAGGSTAATAKAKGVVHNSDVVGSRLLPYMGALAASVSTAGKLQLMRAGKPVSVGKLTRGRYTITVVDRSPKAGFTLRQARSAAMPLTDADFVGRKSLRVALDAGTWTFFSGGGPHTSFVVARK